MGGLGIDLISQRAATSLLVVGVMLPSLRLFGVVVSGLAGGGGG